MDGVLITFESGEGIKKMPSILAAAEFLIMNGIPVLCTREPGSDRGAEAFRRFLEQRGDDEEAAISELVFVNAARLEHVNRVVRPAMEAGFVVLCDRFVHSTLAYQGAGNRIPHETIRNVHNETTADLWPDLTFYLDLPPEETMQRLATKREASSINRFEAKGLEFHQNVRKAFLELCASEVDSIVMIDANRNMNDITADVIHNLSKWFR